jgi:hypothetical protein
MQVSDSAHTGKTTNARNKIFGIWTSFCHEHRVEPSLKGVRNTEQRLCYMLVFSLRYRREGQTGKSVSADTVADALLAVGSGISNLGEPDPRKEFPGSTRNHPLLAAFLKGLRDKDDPAKRSYPANVPIIRNLWTLLDVDDPIAGRANKHVCDLTIIAFYWLLRPAEYTPSRTAGRSQAFRFCDVFFTVGDVVRCATDPSLNDVHVSSVTSAALTFTDQKNGVRGEQVAQRANSDPIMCPAKALFRLTQHLRDHHAPATTPLYTYYDSTNKACVIPSTYITNGLRHSAKNLQRTSGIDWRLLSARSLRPGGATALMCANIDPTWIQLLGRWKSNAMLRYLRIQAHVNNANFSQMMLDHGSFTFAPGVYTAGSNMPLPNETPTAFRDILEHAEMAT